MDSKETVSSLESRLERFEHRLHILEIASALSLVIFVAGVYLAFRIQPASADDSGRVLRVRGVIVEDAQGRPRILLGAPVPKVAGRIRQDDATGLILVGENGADRVAIGAPTPSPQVTGKVAARISPGAGLVIDDPNGNERGGFGVLDNGRGVVCLDYPDPIAREAVCLAVVPDAGFAGVAVNAPSGDNGERAVIAVLKDGTSLLKLADSNGEERTMLVVSDESPAQFLVLDPKAKTKVDVLGKMKP